MNSLIIWIVSILILIYPFVNGELNNENNIHLEKKSLSLFDTFKIQSRISSNILVDKNKEISLNHHNELSFFSGFFSSLCMIIATELGDKTFFLSMLLALKHSRLVVFMGSISALILMTFLSMLIGASLPSILPRRLICSLTSLLYLFFGLKMIFEAIHSMKKKSSDVNEELEEAQVIVSNLNVASNNKVDSLENMESQPVEKKKNISPSTGFFFKIFILTFTAEWADRSQFATITLSTSENLFGVALGASFGHILCSSLAIVAGILFSRIISEQKILFFGGVVFLFFAAHTAYHL